MSSIPDLDQFAIRLRKVIASCSQEVRGAPDGDAAFDELAKQLFALQCEHNPAYRAFCLNRGVVPGKVQGWAEIPAIPATGFKEIRLSCLSPEETTVEFHSSGTTERQPSRHFHNSSSLALYESSLLPWFQQHLFPESRLKGPTQGCALILTPPPEEAPNSSLVHMFECVRAWLRTASKCYAARSARDGSWSLQFSAVTETLNRASAKKVPLTMLGTAFSYVQLLDHLLANGSKFQLPPGSRIMETGGYKGRSRSLPKQELHRLLTEILGVPADWIVSEYGMSELSSQAYDRVAAQQQRTGCRIFQFPPWARAQVVSVETGREVPESDTGLLRIFDLANTFSVMAIQTEDLAVRRGSGFELVGRAEFCEPRGCSLMVVDLPPATSIKQ